jgi:uncharacterized membrane protein YtjA (UPF0391 family)
MRGVGGSASPRLERRLQHPSRRHDMLELALVALVVAVIAGALGFRGVASTAGSIAKFMFVLFLIVAVVLFGLLWAGVSLVA